MVHFLPGRTDTVACLQKKYEKIVLVTHSYGAMLGRLIAINRPDSATGPNAYIQTASSSDLKGIAALGPNLRPQAASVVNPSRFSELPPAYLHVDPATLRETVYGLAGEYDSRMLARDESVSGTHRLLTSYQYRIILFDLHPHLNAYSATSTDPSHVRSRRADIP